MPSIYPIFKLRNKSFSFKTTLIPVCLYKYSVTAFHFLDSFNRLCYGTTPKVISVPNEYVVTSNISNNFSYAFLGFCYITPRKVIIIVSQ